MDRTESPPARNDRTTAARIRDWLASDVTVTLPGWAVAVAGAAALCLVLVALD